MYLSAVPRRRRGLRGLAQDVTSTDIGTTYTFDSGAATGTSSAYAAPTVDYSQSGALMGPVSAAAAPAAAAPVVTVSSPSFWDSIANAIPAALQVYQGVSLTQAQTGLIKAGRPPLTSAMITPPPATLNLGVGVSAQAQKTLLYGGIGVLVLGALLVMSRKRG